MCRGISPTSEMHVEIHMKRGRFWAKPHEANQVIDLQELFSMYWSTNEDKFVVPSKLWITASLALSHEEI